MVIDGSGPPMSRAATAVENAGAAEFAAVHAPWTSSLTCSNYEVTVLREELGFVGDCDGVKRVVAAAHPCLPAMTAFADNILNDWFYGATPLSATVANRVGDPKELSVEMFGSGRRDLLRAVVAEQSPYRLDWAHLFSSAGPEAIRDYLATGLGCEFVVSEHESEVVESWRSVIEGLGPGNARRLMINGVTAVTLDTATLVNAAGMKVLAGTKIRNDDEFSRALSRLDENHFSRNGEYSVPEWADDLPGKVLRNHVEAIRIGRELDLCCGNSFFLGQCARGLTVLLSFGDALMEISRRAEWTIIQFRGSNNTPITDRDDIVADVRTVLERINR